MEAKELVAKDRDKERINVEQCWESGGPYYRRNYMKYQVRLKQEGRKVKGENPKTQHQIHVVVNHREAEHQATILESAGMIKNIPLSVLIDLGATHSFISSSTFIRCGLVACEKSNFRMV